MKYNFNRKMSYSVKDSFKSDFIEDLSRGNVTARTIEQLFITTMNEAWNKHINRNGYLTLREGETFTFDLPDKDNISLSLTLTRDDWVYGANKREVLGYTEEFGKELSMLVEDLLTTYTTAEILRAFVTLEGTNDFEDMSLDDDDDFDDYYEGW